MISSEFEKAVMAGNLLLTRIMLKDSLLLDPTFDQFDEMLSYAKRHFPNLFVPFDGEMLETDETLWNRAVMDQELTALVTNFSEIRVNHLKRVVAKVLAEKADSIRRKRLQGNTQEQSRKQTETRMGIGNKSKEEKKAIRIGELKKIKAQITEINRALDCVNKKGAWNLSDVDKMEQIANEILKAAKKYKENK